MSIQEEERYKEILADVDRLEETTREQMCLDDFDQLDRSICRSKLKMYERRRSELQRVIETGQLIICFECGKNPITLEQLILNPLTTECQVCRCAKLTRSKQSAA